MIVRDVKKGFICDFCQKSIDFCAVEKFKEFITAARTKKRLAIDMKKITSVSNSFWEFLRSYAQKRRIALINLSSDLFAVMSVMRYSDFADVYLSEDDFIAQEYKLINRRFYICR